MRPTNMPARIETGVTPQTTSGQNASPPSALTSMHHQATISTPITQIKAAASIPLAMLFVIAVRGLRSLNRGCFYFFHSIVLLVFPDCQ
ncbi:hypothetical protein GCT13_00600 [Paraburkholderia sp. CNPSo 3157]|uniref:Uncharacterized protein n=1 Tax=Paraburkholderia franconis TaxID=2654983 RepID=A0A7X1TDL9_9BURK|nr:hypothetical protein [Paraburkholderia franconis]